MTKLLQSIHKLAARRLLEHLKTQAFWELEEVDGVAAGVGLEQALFMLRLWNPQEVLVGDLLQMLTHARLSPATTLRLVESDGAGRPTQWVSMWAPVLAELRRLAEASHVH